VTIFGTLLNENYSRLLKARPDLSIDEVIALDKVQKKIPKTDIGIYCSKGGGNQRRDCVSDHADIARNVRNPLIGSRGKKEITVLKHIFGITISYLFFMLCEI
jgi:hypothetical protein